jgi:hypothetical protein
MSKGLIRQWMADRLNRGDDKPGSGGILPLPALLQPTPSLSSLTFAESLLENFTAFYHDNILLPVWNPSRQVTFKAGKC